MSRRNGFTLLELFLTLAMAVVLMTLVNAAFQFYAVEMDQSDEDMRQTMLAASIMQMIEDDLRAALHSEPIDTSALEELLANTAASVTGGQQGGGGGGSATGSTADPATVPEEDTGQELSTSVAVLQSPGLIGNQLQLQVDTSRLPRLEEYVVMLDANPAMLQDIPSDLKTVTYYVQAAGVAGVQDSLSQLQVNQTDAAGADTGGLVRRVIDRAAQNFATESGGLVSLQQTGDLLAPEILAIEFSYWDGMVWQLEWNSDELGELPLAVKIQMQMTSDPSGAQPTSSLDSQSFRLFEHIVRLPLARMIEEEDDSMETGGI